MKKYRSILSKEFYKDQIRANMFEKNHHDSTLKTKVRMTRLADGSIDFEDANMTILGGRSMILEQNFGIVPQANQHVTLNSPGTNWGGVPHSVDVFGTGHAKDRKVNWFMIGNGGEVDDNPLTTYSPFDYETSLYKAVPFRCVPVTQDLDTATMAQYRLKRQIVIQGSSYYAYYAKAFVSSTAPLVLEQLFNGAALNPSAAQTVPVAPDQTASNPLASGTVQVLIDFMLQITDVEFKEWYQLTHGGSLIGARLNELGLVMGYDAPNGLSGGINELAGAELYAKLIHSPVFMDQPGSARQVEYQIFT